jgi:molybdate-binding protein/DNA-binding XRE family transcriptional regulator
MGEFSAKISCRLKEYRQAKGWSQEELASRIGLRRQAIYDIESGRYLPNTAIALRLSREFGCRVEDLFVEELPDPSEPIHIVGGPRTMSSRLALGRVRGRLLGVPLEGRSAMGFGFQPADGMVSGKGEPVRLLCPPDRIEKTVLLLGCDPAFEILGQHVVRLSPDSRVHCRFASSMSALNGLAEGLAHLAGTHLHNIDQRESNVLMASQKLAGASGRVLGFSRLEEGLMVAPGNPLAIHQAADLARPEIRFVNRDAGAALRVLLDDHLRRAGVVPALVNGYANEVGSHLEGAYRVLCGAADAALGLKAIAEFMGLDFVSLAIARCDLVIPQDLGEHPTIRIVLDVLQSAALSRELSALPGYDAAVTGKMIATL